MDRKGHYGKIASFSICKQMIWEIRLISMKISIIACVLSMLKLLKLKDIHHPAKRRRAKFRMMQKKKSVIIMIIIRHQRLM